MNKKFLVFVPILLGVSLTACATNDVPSDSSSSSASSSSSTSSSDTSTSASSTDTSTTDTSLSTTDTTTTVTNQYTITFKDENGDLLESKKWDVGTTPSYSYSKTDTAEWDYTFEGWSLSLDGEVITIPSCSADATYFAVVSKVKKTYQIKFFDEKGTLIQTDTLEYGAQPACSYTGPTDTLEWNYTFRGWSTTRYGGMVLPSIPTVSGNANYYARVESNVQTYSITFAENNGYVLHKADYPYGSTPSYTYETSSSAEWEYTFLGWATTPNGTPLASLPAVSGEATYYAQVNQVKKQYTITFHSNGGSSVASITKDYGTQVNEPTKPSKDGYRFVGWTTDTAGQNAVSWPYTINKNIDMYAQWNEKVDIKGYFKILMDVMDQDPYSYIPDAMRPENEDNHVTSSDVNYNFENFTNVSSIKYGGHGEQWHMVLNNIKESERFYNVLTIGEAAITSSVLLFNNYLDNNPDDTASHSLNETTYTASLDFHNSLLTYSIQYKTNLTIPFFGDVMPQVDMSYNLTTLEKTVRINLTENNAMKYVVTPNEYKFGIEYGVESVSRVGYFNISKDEDTNKVTGHISEFVQYKDKDLVPACADFYIDDEYVTAVGNKASGLVGFTNYISELYRTKSGKMLGYEIQETLSKITYNTLWFNLNNITGINNVKHLDDKFYVNNSADEFVAKKVGGPSLKTGSRRYDIEERLQYFYGKDGDDLVEYETSIPMMFVQEEQLSTFSADVNEKNSYLNVAINLSSTYLTKIEDDYDNLVPTFIENKDSITSEIIEDFIGEAAVIS